MEPLRFAVFGAGLLGPLPVAAWREAGGAECVAIFNRTPVEGRGTGAVSAIPAVYTDPEELLRRESLISSTSSARQTRTKSTF